MVEEEVNKERRRRWRSWKGGAKLMPDRLYTKEQTKTRKVRESKITVNTRGTGEDEGEEGEGKVRGRGREQKEVVPRHQWALVPLPFCCWSAIKAYPLFLSI